MGFVKAADTSQLSIGQKKKVSVGGTDILLSNVDGKYYAVSDKCPHMGGSLSEGNLDGSTITCPRHGAKFDVRTGKAIGDPKILFLKMKVKDNRGYPIKIEGTDILVDVD